MISIAIPDSMFQDDDSLRGKTVKIGEIARAASIFAVERIYIYRDSTRNYEDDFEIARTIFDYAETPQYLRKRLIRKRKELDFVGLLPPLRIPHHLVEPVAKIGQVREAAILSQNGETVADIGSHELAKLNGRAHEGQRATVRLESLNPLIVRTCERPTEIYWGYEVRRAPSLTRFLRSANFELTILTSRLGKQLNLFWEEFRSMTRASPRILVCYGSPESGVDKMLAQDGSKLRDFPKAEYLNFFPFQSVGTIRLEEAVLGSLAILNLAVRL